MSDEEEVKDFGESLLPKKVKINEFVIDSCLRIICGSYSIDEFKEKVKKSSLSEKCCAYLSQDTLAYRCYTCSYSLNVAICEDCFDIFDHEGHNYKQFTSEGGICDCGDPDALKPEGFCKSHGQNVSNPAPSLLENASILIPYIMVKFAMVVEKGSPLETALLMNFLYELMNMGHCLKEIVAKCLMDKSLYNEFFQNFEWSFNMDEAEEKVRSFVENYDKDLPQELVENDLNVQNCLLEWLFKLYIIGEFDDSLSKLLINLLPVENFKVALTETVSKNYLFMITMFMENIDDNQNYISVMPVITIQLLSCRDSIKYIVEKTSFILHTMYCLRIPLVNQSTRPLSWPPAQDAAALFIHKSCVDYFINSPFSYIMFIKGAYRFQIYGLEKRLTDRHVEEDDDSGLTSFLTEMKLCELPLLTMLPSIETCVANIIEHIVMILCRWFYYHDKKASRDHLTFNIPLHRIFSLLISQQIRHGYLCQGQPELEEHQLKFLLEYPLRLKAGLSEIWCKKWIRNGLIMREQAYLYKSSRFFSSFYDPDFFFIQFISSRSSPEYMVEAVIDHFSVMEVLAQDEWYDILNSQNMMEEALFFFAQLLSSRVLAGETEDGLMREEFVTMLSLSDRTYTEIIENIPHNGELVYAQWCSSVEPMLDELAVFAPPGIDTLYMSTSGKYVIKDDILLNEFDPVLVRMRALSLANYTEACQNYYKCVDKNRMKENIKALWPPFRVPTKPVHPFLGEFSNFLHTHIMHGLIYVLLSECIVSGSNEGVLQITIHLLHMILVFPYNSRENSGPPSEGDIYKNCLVPMHLDYGLLEPYGLNNLFKENSHVTPPSIPLFIKTEKIDTIRENARREGIPLPPIVPPEKPEIPPDQTIVSMLLKLYERYAGKLYDPTELHQRNYGLRIGGGDFFIGEVLDALVAGSDEVRKVVEDLTAVDDGAAKKAKLEKKKKNG